MMIGFSPRGCWYEHLLRTLQQLHPQRATARSVPTLDESGFSKGVGIASGSGRTLRIGARKLAVVCSGLGLNRAISKKRASIKLNYLGCEKRREKPLRLFRNQQVAGSIPAGGSTSVQVLAPDQSEELLSSTFRTFMLRCSTVGYRPEQSSIRMP
jgi:hypothetical protein